MRPGMSPDAAPELAPIRFAFELLEMEGAVVDATGAQADVLLPPELARALGWDDLSRLVPSLDDGRPGSRPVAYGSAELERLIDLACTTGSVLCLRAESSSPAQRDLTAEARRRLTFDTKGPVSFGATVRAAVSYLRVHYSFAAASEDTREGLLAVVINESTLAPVPLMSAALDAVQADVKPGGLDPGTGARPLAEVLEAAHREAGRSAVAQLQAFLGSMERRRRRDAERLHQYYGSLAAEAAEARGGRRRHAADAVADRLAAIGAEFERKLRDLELRYAVRVRLRPAAVERVTVPALMVACTLRWKRAERRFEVVWNPLLHVIEPLACDSCGAGGHSLQVTENLQIRCAACST